MAYSVNLMACPPATHLISIANDYQGFPRPFRYFLLSMWGCLGTVSRVVSFNNSVVFGSITANLSRISVHLIPHVSGSPSIDAQYNYAPSGVLQHILVSIDGVAQIAQVYANDQPLALSSGGWVGPPNQFDISNQIQNNWLLGSAGSIPPGPGQGDVFAAAPAAFYDLSITANRRKFIHADLTPVDLGNAATGPLGVAPQIWLTGRSGVPADFATNRGSGGGVWTPTATLAFQAAGMCVAPTSPIEPTTLALDDVLVTAAAGSPPCLISLEWSDDRGHHFGNPVSQPMGGTGEYGRTLTWRRLGYARDRVWKLQWSCPSATALLGAWIEVTPEGKGQG